MPQTALSQKQPLSPPHPTSYCLDPSASGAASILSAPGACPEKQAHAPFFTACPHITSCLGMPLSSLLGICLVPTPSKYSMIKFLWIHVYCTVKSVDINHDMLVDQGRLFFFLDLGFVIWLCPLFSGHVCNSVCLARSVGSNYKLLVVCVALCKYKVVIMLLLSLSLRRIL